MIIRKASLEPIDFDGLTILDYTANAPLGSSMATIEVPPGARHPAAWSKKSDKYYLVVEGQLRFRIGEDTADLSAGDFLFVKQGIVFSYENGSSESAKLVLVHTPAFEMSEEVFIDG